MAGTDASRALTVGEGGGAGSGPGPVVILIEPQMGENIGMAARAMLNCYLTDMRIVRPREAWPNQKAKAACSGADEVLEKARLFDTTADAIADLHVVYAATARPRSMTARVVTPRQCAGEIRALSDGARAGVLFGKESKGLHNDDVALADAIVTAPLNPVFSSLNLAQAVFMVSFEWLMAGAEASVSAVNVPKETRLANKEELLGFFEHLESELDNCGFLRNKEKRPTMVRNLRQMFHRAGLTEQEVRTLRGVVKGLASDRKR